MPNIGDRISYPDSVQGVSQFKVDIAIAENSEAEYGAFAELTEIDPLSGQPYSDVANEIYFTVTPVNTGSGDDERLVWSFNFGYTVSESLSLGNKFKFRFTPAGYDTGNGDAFESIEYLVTEITEQTTFALTLFKLGF